MVNEVHLDEGLNDIEELEILEVVVSGNVQLLEEFILHVKIAAEILRPSEGLAQSHHEVCKITDLDKTCAL
jgi:hypothetical protein